MLHQGNLLVLAELSVFSSVAVSQEGAPAFKRGLAAFVQRAFRQKNA